MACKLPVALNTDMWSIAFRYSTFIILFLTSYYIVSKWWLTSEREKKTSFFFARKFRQRLDSEGEVVTFSLDMTLFTASHTCDVSHVWPRSERFQNGHWLSVKKKLVLQSISFICSSRILWPKRNVLRQKQTNKERNKPKWKNLP